MDHFFQMEAGWRLPTIRCSRATPRSGSSPASPSTLRLRLLVTGVTYRHPGLLAKTVTTLDVLSGGRAELGIGAAWYEREHLGLGVPFPPLAERFELLEEALQICLQMWSDDDGPFDGAHYQLAETLCRPAPVSSPRPRIMIGGSGERKTLRLVAQYADACNFFGGAEEVAAGGFLNGRKVQICALELKFIGGSMGQWSEKRSLGLSNDALTDKTHPLHSRPPLAERACRRLAISLMQLAKLSAALMRLDEAGSTLHQCLDGSYYGRRDR